MDLEVVARDGIEPSTRGFSRQRRGRFGASKPKKRYESFSRPTEPTRRTEPRPNPEGPGRPNPGAGSCGSTSWTHRDRTFSELRADNRFKSGMAVARPLQTALSWCAAGRAAPALSGVDCPPLIANLLLVVDHDVVVRHTRCAGAFAAQREYLAILGNGASCRTDYFAALLLCALDRVVIDLFQRQDVKVG